MHRVICGLVPRFWVLVVGVALTAGCGNPAAENTSDIKTFDASDQGQVTLDTVDAAGDAQSDIGSTVDTIQQDVAEKDIVGVDAKDVVAIDAVDVAAGCTKDTDCSDGNPCTVVSCVSGTCTWTSGNAGAACDDGNICTGGDTCANGKCAAGNILTCDDNDACTSDSCDLSSGCTNVASDGFCSDGDACTAGDTCLVGFCIGAGIDCDDNNACTLDKCDVKLGCVYGNSDGDCSDNNPCTAGDTCDSGKCISGSEPGCDDGNACTTDSCDTTSGCTHQAIDGDCADNNACTSGDLCKLGQCVPGSSVDCDDGKLCTKDACDLATGCTYTDADTLPCDDGQKCSTSDACLHGSCQGNSPECADNNFCTDDTCSDSDGCIHLPSDVTCDDGNVCSVGDVCGGGKCTAVTTLGCDDGKPCTKDSCDVSSGCVNEVTTGPCTDGDACTASETCVDGDCVGSAISCDDGNACTGDSCDSLKGCVHAGLEIGCADGDACTAGDGCVDGKCAPGNTVVCDDGNTCTADSCDKEFGCVFLPTDVSCTDGNACTTGDACAKGKCVPGGNLTCDDENPCTKDGCSFDTGCVYPDADGIPCDDDQKCSVSDACLHAICQGIAPNCDDGNLCSDDTCSDSAGCVHLPNAVTCVDGTACTTGDICQGNKCSPGLALGCDDDNPCTKDSCAADVGCVHADLDFVSCTDGDACTASDICQTGECVGKGIDCNDGNICTADGCNTSDGCTHAAIENDCDDGSACTQGDTCALGKCGPGEDVVCDDKNPCTDDVCDAKKGCVVVANDKNSCDDGNACTEADACLQGKCIFGTAPNCDDEIFCTKDFCDPKIGCDHSDADGIPCDDEQKCSVSDACSGGKCLGVVPNCNDGNVCTDDTCVDGVGCTNVANDSSCDDGNQCTLNDACADSKCTPGLAPDCDDGQVCTGDFCNALSGCAHKDLQGVCNDGDACTSGDACAVGLCAGVTTDCADANPCTVDACDAKGGCSHLAVDVTTACDDNNTCTLNDMCAGTGCKGTAEVCNDGDPCTADGCNPADGCFAKPGNDGAPCNDGSQCTDKDACANGGCNGTTIACNDGNGCTSDGCSPTTGCVYADTTDSCDDGAACTHDDTCANGACIGDPLVSDCDDGNSCTTDSCDNKGCHHAINGAGSICDDDNICTDKDTCTGNVCMGTPHICNDDNVCTDDSCIDGVQPAKGGPQTVGCQYLPNTKPCDDGKQCTTSEVCGGGTCSGTPNLNCDDNNVCTSDSCDNAAGCVHDAVTVATVCSDNNPCTTSDTCIGSSCKGIGQQCNDNDPCTIDTCDLTTGCQSVAGNTGASCTDNDACTTNDVCASGSCVGGVALSCDDGNACTSDSCANGGCVHTGTSGGACSDGNSCTTSDTCASGTCVGTAIACDDSNVCTNDACVNGTGCVYTAANSGAVCSDGSLCTNADHCSAGACVGTVVVFCSADQCHDAGTCVAATGTCSAPTPKSDGVACTDSDACTQADTCQGGTCTGANPVTCPAGDQCNTIGTCDSNTGVCSPLTAKTGNTCDDSNACTTGETCSALGVCGAGTLKVCTGDQCHNDGVCNPADATCAIGTAKTGATCDDGDACTSGTVAIEASSNHTCAIDGGGAAKCWGYNSSGQLGDNSNTESSAPVQVAGLTSGVKAIAAGDSHTCAIDGAGAVKCWGSNLYAQLGDNTTTNQSTPVPVAGLTSGVKAIAAGGYHTCAIDGNGGVQCWGYNGDGQLGDNTTAGSSTPVQVVGLTSGVRTIAAGLFHTCAIDGYGAVTCWGFNAYGQLGDSTTVDRSTPVQVSGLTNGVQAIAAGGLHSCAIDGGGAVKCWGYNLTGGLGDTTTVNKLTPVQVVGLTSGVKNIAAGEQHTCALDGNGAVQCWGYGLFGQLGDNTTVDKFTPVQVVGLTSGVKSVTAGSYNTCAIDGTGAAQCWGYNLSGGLGDGTTVDKMTPVQVLAFGSVSGDACSSEGVCVGGAPVICDDNTSCTNDACVPATGCVNTPDIAACADGNDCTTDVCTSGASATGCTNAAIGDGTTCSDGDACTSGDVCTGTTCAGPTPTTCDAQATCAPASGCVCGEGYVGDGATCSAMVSGISVNGTALAGFALTQLTYAVAYPISTQDATVTVTAAAGVTLTVNGTAVTSGVASAAIALNLGDNVLTVVASAAGTADVTFTITATRGTQQAYAKASNTGATDQFGYAVAISGDTMVVGANIEDSNATGVGGDQTNNAAGQSGAVYVFTRSGTVWSQQAYLKASNTEGSDQFGIAVAISGDTIVVGAPRESSNATGVGGSEADNSAVFSGAVYVFTRSGAVWSQQAYLKASNTGGFDTFGGAVAISGDTIVVGASGEDSNATGVGGNQADNSAGASGAAYVFTRSGTVWSQQAYLKASNTDATDVFGTSVAISGDTIVVGANGEDSNATGVGGSQTDNSASVSGAAYVFTRSGTAWSQQAYLKASNTGAFDQFGLALAISGDTIVVGAFAEDSNATGIGGTQADNSAGDGGAAYVFTRSGTEWSQQAFLKASNTGAGDAFGYSVALSGDTIVVGAKGEASNAAGVGGNQADNSATNSGAAYMFTRSGTVWSQQAYLKASNTGANDAFGFCVAISGDTMVVGAPIEDSNAIGVNGTQADNSAADSGAVYVFQ